MKHFCLIIFSLLFYTIYCEVALVSTRTIFPLVQNKNALKDGKSVNQPLIYSTDKEKWKRNMNIGDKNNNNKLEQKLRIPKVSKKIQNKEYLKGK